jgi:hypothetical protein
MDNATKERPQCQDLDIERNYPLKNVTVFIRTCRDRPIFQEYHFARLGRNPVAHKGKTDYQICPQDNYWLEFLVHMYSSFRQHR